MLHIDWRSGFGYGDFVTGLGYAHNASIKYQTPVNINFHWNHSKDYKETDQDPETIVDRMHYVYGTMRQLDSVQVNVVTDSNPDYRFINNFGEFNPLHGLWHTSMDLEVTNLVVMWRSKYNTYFPGTKKDPVSDRWDEIVQWLQQQGYDVREVTYRTPIAEVMELIRTCQFGIGYDGMIHQLFKYIWKPIVVMCERFDLNQLLIPQAALESKVENLYKNGIDYYLIKSQHNIDLFKQKHNQYINNHDDYMRHPLYNVKR